MEKTVSVFQAQVENKDADLQVDQPSPVTSKIQLGPGVFGTYICERLQRGMPRRAWGRGSREASQGARGFPPVSPLENDPRTKRWESTMVSAFCPLPLRSGMFARRLSRLLMARYGTCRPPCSGASKSFACCEVQV